MRIVYNVYDDDNKIDSKQFDNFGDAFDYAQNGLITYICKEDLDDPEGEEKCVWTWDSTWDRDEAINEVVSSDEDDTAVEDVEFEAEVEKDGNKVKAEFEGNPEEFVDWMAQLFSSDFDQDFPEAKLDLDPVEDETTFNDEAMGYDYDPDQCEDCEVVADNVDDEVFDDFYDVDKFIEAEDDEEECEDEDCNSSEITLTEAKLSTFDIYKDENRLVDNINAELEFNKNTVQSLKQKLLSCNNGNPGEIYRLRDNFVTGTKRKAPFKIKSVGVYKDSGEIGILLERGGHFTLKEIASHLVDPNRPLSRYDQFSADPETYKVITDWVDTREGYIKDLKTKAREENKNYNSNLRRIRNDAKVIDLINDPKNELAVQELVNHIVDIKFIVPGELDDYDDAGVVEWTGGSLKTASKGELAGKKLSELYERFNSFDWSTAAYDAGLVSTRKINGEDLLSVANNWRLVGRLKLDVDVNTLPQAIKDLIEKSKVYVQTTSSNDTDGAEKTVSQSKKEVDCFRLVVALIEKYNGDVLFFRNPENKIPLTDDEFASLNNQPITTDTSDEDAEEDSTLDEDLANDYQTLSRHFGVDLYDLAHGKDGFMQSNYPDGFKDFKGDLLRSNKYWDEFNDWLKKDKNIDLEEDMTDLEFAEALEEAKRKKKASCNK